MTPFVLGDLVLGFVHGDEFIVYYTAANTGHGALVKDRFFTIARAAWPGDRLVALEAKDEPGTVVTKPFKLEGLPPPEDRGTDLRFSFSRRPVYVSLDA